MIESILIGLAYLITWPALVLFCAFGIWCEHSNSRGFAVFWALVAEGVAIAYFGIGLTDIVIYSLVYLVVGIVWSFYRYKRFIVAKIDELQLIGYTNRIADYHPSKMLDTITAWIIIWPFSLIENLCGDIINGIETLVKRVFKGVYNKIYDAAVHDAIRKSE